MKKMYLVTGLVVLTSTPALAEEKKPEFSSAVSGLYATANVGIAMLSDSDNKYAADPGYVLTSSSTSTSEFDSGFTGGAALGYGFGNNVRIEGEIEYQQNDYDKTTSGGVTTTSSSAETSMWSFLGNAYYDFTNSSPLTPYVSAGLGLAKVHAENSEIGFDDDDTVPVAQFGAGVGYAVSNKVVIDLKYRYILALSEPEFAFNHVTVEPEVASHNLMLGLRVGL